MRTIEKDGLLYVCVDDIAQAILNISDDLKKNFSVDSWTRHVASHTAERIGLSVVGGNLESLDL